MTSLEPGMPNLGAWRPVLGALKDVAGITGSFAFGRTGALVIRDMPAMFDDGALTEAGERLMRVGETLSNVGDELELAVIRYQDHKLYLKVLSAGMLCVLAESTVNLAALRMATNLVGRRITPLLEEFDVAAVSPVVEDTVKTAFPEEPDDQISFVAELPSSFAPRPIPGASVRATGARAGVRRFRGRTVE